MPSQSTRRITRTISTSLPVAHGARALSALADRLCGEIEADGNEIVSVSHATHDEGFRNDRIWTVLVAYRKAEFDA